MSNKMDIHIDEAREAKVLRAEHLVKEYGGRKVVDDVSLQIKKGEIIGLLGPNGAGKSTTFYMIVGRIYPESGSVWLGDMPLTEMPMYQRARAGIGYLPQEASIFRSLTVRQNLDLVLEHEGFQGVVFHGVFFRRASCFLAFS